MVGSGCTPGDDELTAQEEEVNQEEIEVSAKEEVEPSEEEEVEGGEKEEAKKEEAKKDNLPTEHKSALKKAESYAETMNMSKAGIYDQLISEHGEKFTQEEAQYAVDNIKAD